MTYNISYILTNGSREIVWPLPLHDPKTVMLAATKLIDLGKAAGFVPVYTGNDENDVIANRWINVNLVEEIRAVDHLGRPVEL